MTANITGFRVVGTPMFRDAMVRVAPGEVVVLVGPNGAGKSSLLKAISAASKVGDPTVLGGGFVATYVAGLADAAETPLFAQWLKWANEHLDYPDSPLRESLTDEHFREYVGWHPSRPQNPRENPWVMFELYCLHGELSDEGFLVDAPLAALLAEKSRRDGTAAVITSSDALFDTAVFRVADYASLEEFLGCAGDAVRERELELVAALLNLKDEGPEHLLRFSNAGYVIGNPEVVKECFAAFTKFDEQVLDLESVTAAVTRSDEVVRGNSWLDEDNRDATDTQTRDQVRAIFARVSNRQGGVDSTPLREAFAAALAAASGEKGPSVDRFCTAAREIEACGKPQGALLTPMVTKAGEQLRAPELRRRVVPVGDDWDVVRALVTDALRNASDANEGSQAAMRIAENANARLADLPFLENRDGSRMEVGIVGDLAHLPDSHRIFVQCGIGVPVAHTPSAVPAGFRSWIAVAVAIAAAEVLRDGLDGGCVFLLDEPESHLDASSRAEVAIWIDAIAKEGRHSFIIASHSSQFVLGEDWRRYWLKWVRLAESQSDIHHEAQHQNGDGADDDVPMEVQPSGESQWSVELAELPRDVEGERVLEDVGIARRDEVRHLLLVEGPDDRIVLNTFYGDDLERAGIMVLPVGGGLSASRAKEWFWFMRKWCPHLTGLTVLRDLEFQQPGDQRTAARLHQELQPFGAASGVLELDFPDILFYVKCGEFDRDVAFEAWKDEVRNRDSGGDGKSAAARIEHSPWQELKRLKGSPKSDCVLELAIGAKPYEEYRADLTQKIQELIASVS